MAQEDPKKSTAELPLAPVPAVAAEKTVSQVPEKKPDETKALAIVDKAPDSEKKKISGGSLDRDVALAGVENEKRLSYIKAWEESEKAKSENKAQKKLSDVTAWENSKRATVEAKLKKMEEQLERKKAEYAEKMKNKVALIHKQAEEKRAMVEAKRAEEFLKAEETGAKYRATNTTPKKSFGCF